MAIRSLRSLTVAFLFAFLAATVGTGLLTFAASRRTAISLVDQRLAAVGAEVLRGAAAGDPRRIAGRIATVGAERDTGDIGFELRDHAGAWLAGNVHLGRRLVPGYASLDHADGIAGLTHGRALVRDAGRGMTLLIAAETEPIDRYRAASILVYLGGFGSIILIVTGGLVLFSTLVGRRMAQLRRTADAIFEGDMLRRVPTAGAEGEFAALAAAFNRMLDRVADLMAGIANVSNDIAHDLRTPLARLRGQLSSLAQRAPDASWRAKVDDATAQCDLLLATFAATLRIVEVEAGDRRRGFVRFALDDLVREVLETMQPLADERGDRIAPGRVDAVSILGDRQLLAQALMNLVDNALRHAPAGTAIDVDLASGAGSVVLSVSDNGSGIPPDQRALALRRFGRLDPDRNRQGHGLGLPLVDAIARLHGGELRLADAAPGLRVILTIPQDLP